MEDNELNDLVRIANHAMMSQGTISTGSLTSVTTGTGTYTIPNLNTWGSAGYQQYIHHPPKELSLEEKIQEVIFMTEDDPEVCRFLKAAKATIDKRILDKINEHLDGDSKPDRETGEDG